MPRYLIERTFPDGLKIPMTAEGAQACLGVVGRNAEDGVTWTQAFENVLPMLGTEFAETTFSLGGEESVDGKKLTKIDAKTELLFEPEENPRMEMEILEQEGSATAYFDNEAGHLVKSEGKQKAVKEISGQQEVSQDITETFKMYLGKSPAAEKKAEEKPAAK